MGTHVKFYPVSNNFDHDEWPKNFRLDNVPRVGENVDFQMESGEWFFGKVKKITWRLSAKPELYAEIILEGPELGSY
jgi:hypothetical protein